MTTVNDPHDRAALYSQMAAQAERLGDHYLLQLTLQRLGHGGQQAGGGRSGGKVIPLFGPPAQPAIPIPAPQPLWAVIFKTALIPVGMALILTTMVQFALAIPVRSADICKHPNPWVAVRADRSDAPPLTQQRRGR